MKFRDDIDPANTWLVSDTHFGHDNIVGYCFRPEDHEQVMIAQWRATVPEGATVIHLGDLAYSNNARFRAITAKELPPYTHADAPKPHKGRKLLIEGNHDRQRRNFYRQAGFQIVRPFYIALNEDGSLVQTLPAVAGAAHVVSFSHYPWNEDEEGRRMNYDDLRIHGHIHNNGYSRDAYVPFLRQHINLSMEQTRYTPVNLQLLLDAALLGRYPETTDEQLADARARREANR